MNLDEQLRAALSEEAELHNAPRPDMEGLISGGRVRRRRRNVARVGAVAAAVVLIGGAAYGVMRIDPGQPGTEPGIVDQPSEPSEPAPNTSAQNGNRRSVEPGTYRMFVGVDAAGERIAADMTVAGTGWASGDNLVVFDGDRAAGVGIYQPQLVAYRDELVAAASGCSGDWQGRDAAETPQGLARQLARLPLGTVVQPPTPTEAFGHDGVHLRVRIDDRCPIGQFYRVAQTPTSERGISYSDVPKEVVIDFWVVDLDGTAVVVDLWHQVDASTELVDRATQARDSITFVPAE